MSAQPAMSQSALLQVGLNYHQQGLLQLAEHTYRQVLYTHPSDANAWHLLGVVLFQVGRHAEAAQAVEKAISFNPKDAGYHYNLGNIYCNLGRIDKAEGVYNQAVALSPGFVDALGQLGFVYLQTKRYSQAEEAFKKALDLDPNHYSFWNNLGNTYKDQDRFEEAIEAYQQGLAVNPKGWEVLNNVGTAYAALGKKEDAKASYVKSLELNPNQQEANANLAGMAIEAKDFDTAQKHFETILSMNANNAEGWFSLGTVYQLKLMINHALECYDKALAINPNEYRAMYNAALILIEQAQYAQGLMLLRKVVELDPDSPAGWANLISATGNCELFEEAKAIFEEAKQKFPNESEIYNHYALVLSDAMKYDEAMALFLKAQELDPSNTRLINNIGMTYLSLGDPEKALEYCEKAIEYHPEMTAGYNNLGNAQCQLEMYEEAGKNYQKAIDIQPNIELDWQMCLFNLVNGRFVEGWKTYEIRKIRKGFPKYPFVQPEWEGQDLKGKTLLLVAEQGFGDMFQCTRYFKLLKEKGARLIFASHPLTVSVFKECPYLDEVINRDTTELNELKYDYWMFVMSLHHRFGITVDTVPAVEPALELPKDRLDHWKKRLSKDKNLKIGICWSGNPRQPRNVYKACGPDVLKALSKIPGVTFYSLQKEIPPGLEYKPVKGLNFIDLEPDLPDFVETACAMTHLDLIISVDTVIAHLAGILQKPVWMMLPFGADYRWMIKRLDSPWYPTMRIFRQPALRDWNSVYQQVESALQEYLTPTSKKTAPRATEAKKKVAAKKPVAKKKPAATKSKK